MESDTFEQHLKKYLPDHEIESLTLELKKQQIYSCLLADTEKISLSKLKEIFPSLIPHPVVPNAFLYKKEEMEPGKSLLFEIGAFYLLEPCSPLVAYFLSPSENDLVLDLAAAPGGKCIHASFLMTNHGQILANEIRSSRAEILSSNIEKYGRKNVIVCSEDPEKLENRFPDTFSKIILDAPCSGSGMFRKEQKMREDWSLEKVHRCAALQKELILMAYNMLIPGGELVYSTCSFSYEEDEEVIDFLLSKTDAVLLSIPFFPGEYRSSMKEAVHLFPHRFQGEGHFIAKIKKPGILTVDIPKKTNTRKEYLNLPEGYLFINRDEEMFLTNRSLSLKGLHILRAGIKIGKADAKRGIVYDHAVSRLTPSFLPSIEVTETEAKEFILGMTLQKECHEGYVILTYLSIPFALGKSVHGQIKNHYPKGLRKKI